MAPVVQEKPQEQFAEVKPESSEEKPEESKKADQQEDLKENGNKKVKGKEGKEGNKEQPEGRLYKCSKCDKTYLSYPALYTHTKLKHLQPGESPSITNGRMRGRPRKNIVKLNSVIHI
jgi:hypothetical protein